MAVQDFEAALQKRRSIYALGNSSPISDEDLVTLIQDTVKYSPSAFNSQSARAVVLFGEANQKLWNIVLETLRKIVPADNFSSTENKIASFAAGHGTVLWFDDTEITENLKKQFSLYADNFDPWAEQSNGMAQHAVWIALAQVGLGASLQHYNPLIDDEVKSTFGLPTAWRLRAQMPFGSIEAPAGEKEFAPIEDRVKVFGLEK
ncbi:MAG: nitroreductase family protein [Bifidobacteriaceae bacterium]|jgi:predicted oxidoreductase (fatty acid repression mutant protein)|nr:nitroreductase family protein [Bifidobacteriaceae bacterium]MCI1979160.1 nitroreductase family protein [Bifidobacteriaceae bacterium]